MPQPLWHKTLDTTVLVPCFSLEETTVEAAFQHGAMAKRISWGRRSGASPARKNSPDLCQMCHKNYFLLWLSLCSILFELWKISLVLKTKCCGHLSWPAIQSFPMVTMHPCLTYTKQSPGGHDVHSCNNWKPSQAHHSIARDSNPVLSYCLHIPWCYTDLSLAV